MRRDHYPKREARREGRYFVRQHGSGLFVHEAYSAGQEAAYRGKAKRNHYPPGRRHDAYEDGYWSADPMGMHHGDGE